jgi:hypothetical protein
VINIEEKILVVKVLTFVELTYSCTVSIQPPNVYLKAKYYKYFPTKVYPDEKQNSTKPNLKKQKNNNKIFLGKELALTEVITCHQNPSSSYATEIQNEIAAILVYI